MTPRIKHTRSNDITDAEVVEVDGTAAEGRGEVKKSSSTAATSRVKDEKRSDSKNSRATEGGETADAASISSSSSSTGPPPAQRRRKTAPLRNDKAPPAAVARRTRPPRDVTDYIPAYLQQAGVVHYHGDFCGCLSFHARLVAHVMAEGFLPIANVAPASIFSRRGAGHGGGGRAAFEYVLLPKLHAERCVVQLPTDLHVSKSVRKKANKFRLTINQEFDRVVEGCQRQHGYHCWLYPPLVEAFRQIHQQTLVAAGGSGYEVTVAAVGSDSNNNSGTTTTTVSVRLYSLEVWNATTNELVAGELGYTVGNTIYTSLTGFSNQDSAGSVQLAALGRLLCQQQFQLWDLGMEMEYKRTLGSHLMPRDEFVQHVHQARQVSSTTLPLPQWKIEHAPNCRQVIDQKVPKDDDDDDDAAPESVEA